MARAYGRCAGQSRARADSLGKHVRSRDIVSIELPAFVCADRRVARALRFVLQDLTKRATCASAARVAGLDRAYFSKRFASVMRVSFTEWNARVRIGEAKRLLRAIDLSITAVAASVGYEDVTTFERAFKRVEGVCPRGYRQRITRTAETGTPNAETAPAPRT
jgi:AraC-like DNA-binding protein